jgi:hypothetical protein
VSSGDRTSGRPLLRHAAATVGTYLVLALVACEDKKAIRADGIPRCAPNAVVAAALTSRDNRRRLSAAPGGSVRDQPVVDGAVVAEAVGHADDLAM